MAQAAAGGGAQAKATCAAVSCPIRRAVRRSLVTCAMTTLAACAAFARTADSRLSLVDCRTVVARKAPKMPKTSIAMVSSASVVPRSSSRAGSGGITTPGRRWSPAPTARCVTSVWLESVAKRQVPGGTATSMPQSLEQVPFVRLALPS